MPFYLQGGGEGDHDSDESTSKRTILPERNYRGRQYLGVQQSEFINGKLSSTMAG